MRLRLSSHLGTLLCFCLLFSCVPIAEGNFRAKRQSSNDKDKKEEETEHKDKERALTFLDFVSLQWKQLCHGDQRKQDVQDVSNRSVYIQQHDYQDFFQPVKNSVALQLRTSQKGFKRRLLQDIFYQHVGAQRLFHSIRDGIGVILGFWVTFRGQVHPVLKASNFGGGGCIALQIGQLTWYILNTHTFLIHGPWLHDLVSIAVTGLVFKYVLPQIPEELKKHLPSLFFPIVFLRIWSLVLEQWTSPEGRVHFPLVLLATGYSSFFMRIAHIPIPLVASSVSGAFLVYDSMCAEIAGNWLYMLQHLVSLVPPLLRLIRHLAVYLWRPALALWRNWLKNFVKNMFFPETTKNFFGQLIGASREASAVIMSPINKLRQTIAEHPLMIQINEMALSLRRAVRPVMVPMGIATWGVAVQMNYITEVGDVWKLFRWTLDPVSFTRNNLKEFLSPESRARAYAISILRHILGRGGKSLEKSKGNPG